jgi:hypothetical protein
MIFVYLYLTIGILFYLFLLLIAPNKNKKLLKKLRSMFLITICWAWIFLVYIREYFK